MVAAPHVTVLPNARAEVVALVSRTRQSITFSDIWPILIRSQPAFISNEDGR